MKAGLLFCAPLVLALVAGCVISPRRTVNNTGFPSPSPTVSPGVTPSPTPFPTVTVTPTPTATPTPTPAVVMSVIVTAMPGEAMLSASLTHADGSTSPLPGSPFVVAEAPRKLMSLGAVLLVQGESSVSVFDVNRDTGSLNQTAFIPAPLLRDAVVNPADSTLYLLDQNSVSEFRVEKDQMIALPGSPFPISLEAARQQVPRALAFNCSADSLYVAFASTSGGTPESFAVLKRSPDGSLGDFSATSDIPQDVQRIFSDAASTSSSRGRMAALITLQANR